MSEVSMGDVYSLNKDLMKTMKPLKDFEIKDKVRPLKYNMNKKYYCLMCREKYDFTIFKIAPLAEKFEKVLFECLTNRGEVLAIDTTEDENKEIWLLIDGEAFVYYLFPYEEGVIEVGV